MTAAAVTQELDMDPPRRARLRIAVFTDTFAPQVNGVARTLGRLREALEERGCDVRVFTAHDPRETAEREVVRLPSVAFWAYPELRLSRPRARQMVGALNAWAPDLVHVATPFGLGLSGRAAARHLGVPLVSSYHTSFSAYAGYYHLGLLARPGWTFLRWFHNGAQRTYVPTFAIQRELEEQGFRNVAIWSRGVDTRRFSPRWRSDDVRRSLGVPDDGTLVVYIGRLAKEKGLDVAIDAMHRVRSQRSDVVFAFVGDGPYERECRRRAPQGSVFLGRRTGDELSRYYASADIQLFPSVTDTFGNVLLEGMASRLAIVAAYAPSSREVLGTDGGILVPPTAPGAFASAIIDLLRDRDARDHLAACAAMRARTFAWDQIFDNLLSDYRRVIASSRGPSVRANGR